MTQKLSILIPAAQAEDISEWIWSHLKGVEGLQEAPASGEALFQMQKGFEILEFGSEAAKKAARWLETDAFRGNEKLLLIVFLNDDQTENQVRESLQSLEVEFHGILLGAFEKLEDCDYLEEYRKNVKGSCVGKNFWVGPPWDEEAKTTSRIPLIVEPGLAFGTGEHPTTQMILERLEELVSTLKRPLRVWDLGAGTGVLGLAAKKIFPQIEFLLLSDLDPLCREEIEKTFRLNGEHVDYKATVVDCGESGRAESICLRYPRFDVVISNIYAEILAELVPFVRKAICDDGLWLCSGILEGSSEKALDTRAHNFFLQQQRRSKTQSASILNSHIGMQKVDECWVFHEYAPRS